MPPNHIGPRYVQSTILGTITTDATGELDILGHDGFALGMDGEDWCLGTDSLGEPPQPPANKALQ